MFLHWVKNGGDLLSIRASNFAWGGVVYEVYIVGSDNKWTIQILIDGTNTLIPGEFDELNEAQRAAEYYVNSVIMPQPSM